MSKALDKHDEQYANLKKAAAICEQQGQGLIDSLIALQAKVEELTPWREKGMSLVMALQDNSNMGVNRAEAIIAELGVLALKQEGTGIQDMMAEVEALKTGSK